MNLRRTAGGAAMAVVVALALAACSGGGAPVGKTAAGGTLTIGAVVEPTSLAPSQAQEGHQMQYFQAVYDSLILRAPDGELKPMLATSWAYDNTKKKLTLKLRDDVTFSDGKRFDAAAVKANIESFQTSSGPQGSTLSRVASVDVTDDFTVALNLTEPEPALLIYLSNAAGLMASPAALGTDAIATQPVGSGPYTLDVASTTIGSQYTYVKTKNYWNPELQKFDRIVIKPIQDVTARYNALVSGQVDVTTLEAKTADQAEAARLVPFVQQLNWQGLLLMDRGGAIVPALADVRVRQAINYAIDKAAILKEIQRGRGELTAQVFGTASSAFDASLENSYPYDPAKAKALIAKAGYADGITIPYPTLSALDPALTAVITEQLAAVGITLKLQEVPATQYITEVTSGRYPVAWMNLFQPSTWVAVNQIIAPSALFNAFDTKDSTVTALIEKIQVGDEAASADAAKQLNAYVTEQAWFAPWFRADALYYGNGKVDVDLQVEQVAPSIYNYRPVN